MKNDFNSRKFNELKVLGLVISLNSQVLATYTYAMQFLLSKVNNLWSSYLKLDYLSIEFTNHSTIWDSPSPPHADGQ